jgi:hypothetical protein
MGKKPFLVPKILGVLFAVSVITACPELPDFEITIIDLSEVWPKKDGTPKGLEKENKSVLYDRTATWEEITYPNGKVKHTPMDTTDTTTKFDEGGVYEATFTLRAKEGCFFDNEVNNDKIICDENRISAKNMKVTDAPAEITVTVRFRPVYE